MSKNEKITDRSAPLPSSSILPSWLLDLATRNAVTPAEDEDTIRARCRSLAIALTRIRDLRNKTFGDQIPFADPAWDILLDLYLARLNGQRLSVTDVAVGAQVPPTTALRWITLLTEKNAIERARDPHDRRRTFLSLTDSQFYSLDAFFRSVSASISSTEASANRSSIMPSGR